MGGAFTPRHELPLNATVPRSAMEVDISSFLGYKQAEPVRPQVIGFTALGAASVSAGAAPFVPRKLAALLSSQDSPSCLPLPSPRHSSLVTGDPVCQYSKRRCRRASHPHLPINSRGLCRLSYGSTSGGWPLTPYRVEGAAPVLSIYGLKSFIPSSVIPIARKRGSCHTGKQNLDNILNPPVT